jgi:hypothetical protein
MHVHDFCVVTLPRRGRETITMFSLEPIAFHLGCDRLSFLLSKQNHAADQNAGVSRTARDLP